MPVFERIINLSVQGNTVFRYLSEPSHFLELCRNLVAISDIQRHVPDSTVFKWTAKLFDVRFDGDAELKSTRYDYQLDLQIRGGLRGNLIWRLHPTDAETVVALWAEYVLPEPLLKKHDTDSVHRHIEESMAWMLTRLKTVLEGGEVGVTQTYGTTVS